jgi:acyl-CoA synthetase (NDP forming)
MLASATANHYRKTIAALQADENVDSVLAIFVPPLVTDPLDVADAIGSLVTHGATKPVLAAFISAEPPPVSLSHVPCPEKHSRCSTPWAFTRYVLAP